MNENPPALHALSQLDPPATSQRDHTNLCVRDIHSGRATNAMIAGPMRPNVDYRNGKAWEFDQYFHILWMQSSVGWNANRGDKNPRMKILDNYRGRNLNIIIMIKKLTKV
jgi:hypothetical protein